MLGPNDDITRFEYLKRNNRDIGTALVGIELGDAADLEQLFERIENTGPQCEYLRPGSSVYEYLI